MPSRLRECFLLLFTSHLNFFQCLKTKILQSISLKQHRNKERKVADDHRAGNDNRKERGGERRGGVKWKRMSGKEERDGKKDEG